eukprot:m.187786 g.187786  ORF g.187786 m.187786 type:complete len:293 (-) comp14781_c0_seq1:441-1319(-)
MATTSTALRPWTAKFEEENTVMVNQQGIRLHRYEKVPTGEKKALLYFCHGVGEHLGRYHHFFDRLVEAGYVVFAHDLVGHGRSEGERVRVSHFSVFQHDVIADVVGTRQRFPELKVFYCGVSLGGLIGCLASLEYPFDGLILVAPAVKVDPALATPFTVAMAQLFEKVWPSLGVVALDTREISRNMEEVTTYDADPLVYHSKYPAAFGMKGLRATEYMQNHVNDITCPLLVLHGASDKITNPDASKFLVDNSSSTDKRMKLFPDCKHNLLQELPETREEVMADIVEFLDARC